ncbi:hypothetical protein [Streptomyces sp. NPDC097640]|uniref:hypothetical protein n=1 Tax=Streptomyces sp. NPDC097640 TaxID=3157229 RepID=UPI00331B1AEA
MTRGFLWSEKQLLDAVSPPAARKRWYRGLGARVVIAMALGVAVGFAFPGFAVNLKIIDRGARTPR